MARHGENIYKRKDGRYEGRYVIGKTAKGTTKFGYIFGRQYHDVRQRLLLKKAEYMRQRSNTTTPTFGVWVRAWMRQELYGSVKLSSYQVYQNLVQRYLLPQLEYLSLQQITPLVVQEFVVRLQQTALAESTIRGIYRLLCASMRSALEEGLIQKNPCKKIKLYPPEATEQRVLTKQEQARMQMENRAQDLPALLSLYTGMRLGEVCALQWTDIDWTASTITVRRTVQRVSATDGGARKTMLMLGTPKSYSSHRVIPVPSFILEHLRTRLKEQGPTLYVFGHSQRTADPRTIQRIFQRQTRRLGIAGAHFHTLRHSFAANLLALGVDIKTVSLLLGHSSVKITLDYYAHSCLDQRRTAIAKLCANNPK